MANFAPAHTSLCSSDICHIVKVSIIHRAEMPSFISCLISSLQFRMEVLGFEVVDREKLFEGVYSEYVSVRGQDPRLTSSRTAHPLQLAHRAKKRVSL